MQGITSRIVALFAIALVVGGVGWVYVTSSVDGPGVWSESTQSAPYPAETDLLGTTTPLSQAPTLTMHVSDGSQRGTLTTNCWPSADGPVTCSEVLLDGVPDRTPLTISSGTPVQLQLAAFDLPAEPLDVKARVVSANALGGVVWSHTLNTRSANTVPLELSPGRYVVYVDGIWDLPAQVTADTGDTTHVFFVEVVK
jgi:hypothetical protein